MVFASLRKMLCHLNYLEETRRNIFNGKLLKKNYWMSKYTCIIKDQFNLSASQKEEICALDRMIHILKILLIIVYPIMLISSIYFKITFEYLILG